jgi:hypothetical protein
MLWQVPCPIFSLSRRLFKADESLGLPGAAASRGSANRAFRGGAMSSVETIASNSVETTMFKVIIARHSNSEVLLVHDGHDVILPAVAIPKWTRFTPQIAECVLQQSGLRTISLFHPEAQDTVEEPGDQYVILEPRDAAWQPSPGFRWVSRDGLRNSLSSKEEAQLLEDALAKADAYNSGTLHGTFARAGWFDELVSWVQGQLDPYGLTITGEFRQLNCGPTFSLVRLETSGPAVWFKAVGEPNLREFPITTALAQHFPSYVPTLIGTQPSWNGWLTFEAEGSILNEKSDIATWEKASQTVAELQIQSAIRAPALLDAGCRNVGIPMLSDQIDPFFHVMAELMAKQPKVPPPTLSSEEVHTLAAHMKEACTCLAAIGLPDTLGHMDFNPGNIIGSPDGCVFLDWAEAYVGHPFFTFEYLREHLFRGHPGQNAWQSQVTSCYLEPWSAFGSMDQASRALEITPLVAVFAYALSSNTWQDSHRLQNPKIAGYFRSLTRRMQREARLQDERREQCLN